MVFLSSDGIEANTRHTLIVEAAERSMPAFSYSMDERSEGVSFHFSDVVCRFRYLTEVWRQRWWKSYSLRFVEVPESAVKCLNYDSAVDAVKL